MTRSEVSMFLQEHGLGSYCCIMEDQGFEDLTDLFALSDNEREFKELIPAAGHRMKIQRLLKSHFGGGATTTPPSTVGVATIPAAPSLRRTAAVEWLDENNLGAHAERIQQAGYGEDVLDLKMLLEKTQLCEHLIPIAGHRDRMRRLLDPAAGPSTGNIHLAEQWLGGLKTPEPEVLSHSNVVEERCEVLSNQSGSGDVRFTKMADPLQKLLNLVGQQYCRSAVSAPPDCQPQQAILESDALSEDEPRYASSSSDDDRKGRNAKQEQKTRRRSQGQQDNSDPRQQQGPHSVYVAPIKQYFDEVLFQDTDGLASAMRGNNVDLCDRPHCDHKCNRLHFRTMNVKHEHITRQCSAFYVSQVTSGLLASLRTGERVSSCSQDDCTSSSCGCVHLAVHCPDAQGVMAPVPFQLLCLTDPLAHLMSKPVPLQDKKFLKRLSLCTAFDLTLLCPKGSHCGGFHQLPNKFKRFFFKSVPVDKILRHCKSLNHLAGTEWDLNQRMERTKSRSLDVGEALDFLLNTTCRPCALLLFDVFKNTTRRRGNDFLWTLLFQLDACQGRQDPSIVEMTSFVNNILQLKSDECLTATSSIRNMYQHTIEAIGVHSKKINASPAYHGASSSADEALNAYVYWDFDNILFADRGELSTFFHCLTTFLCREGLASNKSAIHVKAFGTQNSFADRTVDTLRDMQVEMVLCSNKKQEEADRQMERSMRSLEHRKNTSVIVLSSDKDFNSIVKELNRSGVNVVVIHCAEESSNHEVMLRLAATRSVHLFEVYAAGWKPFKPQRQHAPLILKGEHTRAIMETASNVHVDPAIAVAIPQAAAATASLMSAVSPTPQKNILEFFGSGKASSSNGVQPRLAQEIESSLLQATRRTSSERPSGSDFHVTDLLRRNVVQGSANTTTVPTTTATPAAAVPLPRSKGTQQQQQPAAPVFVSLVSSPQPPQEHRAWFSLFADAFLVRLQDRRRCGDLRGPFAPHATEDSIRREIRVFVEMAHLVPKFLPPWFSSETAIRLMHRRVVDDDPEEWLDNEHILRCYHGDEFMELFQVLRFIATVVDGPLSEAAFIDLGKTPPSIRLRTTGSS